MTQAPYRERQDRAKALVMELADLEDMSGPEALALRDRARVLAASFNSAYLGYSPTTQKRGVAARSVKIKEYRERIYPILRQVRAEGTITYNAIADRLNALNIPSFSGKPWRTGMLFSILRDLDALDSGKEEAA